MPNWSLKNWIIPFLWVTILLFNINNFFFWDTIQLSSKQAYFFYDNNFSSFFLPENINSGHPPFFGIFLAFIWKVFGKSLMIGHLIMIIVVLGTIFQAQKLGNYILNKKYAFLLPLILLLNPIFLGHSLLVSPDNLLVFFILLSINSKIKEQNWLFAISCLGLSMLSMRGMMTVFALFVGEFLFAIISNIKIDYKQLYKYSLAAIFTLIFFVAHYLHNKWLGFHKDSPWIESFNMVNFKGYIYNLGIITWRILDFGNVFIIIPILFIAYKIKNQIWNEKYKTLFSYLLAFTIVFVIPVAGFKYLSAHRYFMPIYLLISILFMKLIFDSKYYKIGIISLLLLFSGNWWVYPVTISQGWDVSYAHVPFYKLTHDMYDLILENNIDPNEIGTEFPLKSDSKYLHLNDSFISFKEADLSLDKYILYSKVMNDFKDSDLSYIENHFKLIFSLKKNNIDLKLYERRS